MDGIGLWEWLIDCGSELEDCLCGRVCFVCLFVCLIGL